jgi:hypothetical protein
MLILFVVANRETMSYFGTAKAGPGLFKLLRIPPKAWTVPAIADLNLLYIHFLLCTRDFDWQYVALSALPKRRRRAGS